MKKINFKYIAFTLVVLLIIGIFAIRLLILTHNRNIGFDSQEFFINGGYKDAYNNATSKVEDDNQYLKDNGTRIASYNINLEVAAKDIEASRGEEILAELKETESKVTDKSSFKADVQVILEREFLTLNIKAYDMLQNNVLEDRDVIYKKLKNIEVFYDAYVNDLELHEVSIADTDGSSLIDHDLSSWDLSLSRKQVNILVALDMIIIIVLFLFTKIKAENIKLLVIFTIVLLSSIFGYRIIEDNYDPIYVLINKEFGVNQNSNDEYFINFVPITVADTFVSHGGNFYRMPENVYDINNDVQIPPKYVPVDWSNKESVELWLDMPYEGDTSVSNGNVLERIRVTINLPLSVGANHSAGDFGIGGWNFSGIENVNKSITK